MPALISPYKGTADTVVDPGPTQTIVEVFQGDEAVTDPHATGDGGSDITSQKEMQDYRLKELLRESAKKMMKTKWSVGSDGKEFHFFLSHKKQHSRDGSVHAQIAANMSDALTNLNFTPFLDIDTLTEITTQGIRDACMKSCSMVVLLNNETKDSEWCNLEWKVLPRARAIPPPLSHRVAPDRRERGARDAAPRSAPAMPRARRPRCRALGARDAGCKLCSVAVIPRG